MVRVYGRPPSLLLLLRGPAELHRRRAIPGGVGLARRRSSVRIRTGARPGKLLFLSERLAVPIDRSRRPYQSFRRLSKFRDEMVHVRQEKVDTEVVTSLEEIGRESHIPPIVARESVHRIRADLEDLGNRLFHGARAGGLEVNKDWTAFRGSVSVRAYHDIPSEMVVLSKLKADGSSSLRRSRVTPERASNPGDRVPAGSWQVGVPFSSRRRSSVG